MKKLFSLLLAVIMAVGASLACAAQEVGDDRFAVNAQLLKWYKAEDSQESCTIVLLQSDPLYAMQPNAQFTVYSHAQEADPLTEVARGGAALWTRSAFTDANGTEHIVWTLPDIPEAACYLQFAAGAFTDQDGNSVPETCARFSSVARARLITGVDTALDGLQTVKTDADLVEGETISYPQNYQSPPAAYFSVQIRNDAGVSCVTPSYNSSGSLCVPAAAGSAEYTLLFCGRPIGSAQTVRALTHAEYADLYQKDRRLSVIKGIALIPCLPVFMLLGGFEGGLAAAALSVAFTPTIVFLPFTLIAASFVGSGEGAAGWWQMICDLIGGRE